MLERILRFLGQQFKLLLLLALAASFVFWGVADMVMHKSNDNEVARVGSIKIGERDFRTVYNTTRERYHRSPLSRNLSDEALIKMGLPRQVLDGLINDRLLQLEAQSQGLTVTEKTVAEITAKNPTFADKDGKFDRAQFQRAIQAMGLSEKSYIEAMRTNESSQQLGFALFSQKVLHPVLFQAVHLLRQEARDARVWVFTQSLSAANTAPTAAQLKDYFEAHSADFQAPEYRTFGLIYLDPKKTGEVTISEDELQDAYAQQKAQLTTPETKKVDQLLFADEAAAQAAQARVKAGEPWEKIAADASVKNKGATDLGDVSRAKALPGLKDTIFAMKDGETSAPVKSAFGWHLLRVRGTTPETVKSFESVKDDLRKGLEKQRAEDALYHQIDQLENALAAGADLESAAKAAEAKVVRLGPIDARGLKPDGNSQLGLPPLNDFLARGFALKGQDTTSAIALPDGRSVVAGLLQVTPSTPRSFEQSQGELLARWTKDNRATAVQKLADRIAAESTGADAAARTAGAFDAAVAGIKRGTQASLRDPAKNVVPLPKEMVEALFTLREGQHTKSFVLESGDVAFATLEKVHTAADQMKDKKETLEDLGKARDALQGEVGADMYQLYIQYLRKKYDVRANEGRLNALLAPSKAEE